MKDSDFEIEPDLGAADPEPSLGAIIFRYYLPHLGTRGAVEMADRYIVKLMESA